VASDEPHDVSEFLPLLHWRNAHPPRHFGSPHALATADRSPHDVHERHTAFGGAFLLLPLLAELPIDTITVDWPACGDTPASRLVRFLLLAQCLGGTCTPKLFQDTLLRHGLRIDERLQLTDAVEWMSQVTSQQAMQLESGAITWLRDAGAISGRSLVLARARDHERGILVLVDCDRGHWLLVRPSRAARLPRVLDDLRPWLELADADGGVLLVQGSPILTDEISASYPRLGIVPTQVHTADVQPDESYSVAATYARLPQLGQELQYLAPPPPFRERAIVRHAFALAANAVLRRFAWRLPGFSRASLPQLWTNFLDFSARVEESPTRRVVRLSPPPLDRVLDMTGLTRASYCVPWLDHRPFALCAEPAM
jgi:hypothetical protein